MQETFFKGFNVVFYNVKAVVTVFVIFKNRKCRNYHSRTAYGLPVVGTVYRTPSARSSRRLGNREVAKTLYRRAYSVILYGVIALHHSLVVKDIGKLATLLGLVVKCVVYPIVTDDVGVRAICHVKEMSLSPMLPFVELLSKEIEGVGIFLLTGDLIRKRKLLHLLGKGTNI